tara:strand:+ start:350 stop:460 length:111 start_codon:yes stop_codon:yes gene_type:complete
MLGVDILSATGINLRTIGILLAIGLPLKIILEGKKE